MGCFCTGKPGYNIASALKAHGLAQGNLSYLTSYFNLYHFITVIFLKLHRPHFT